MSTQPLSITLLGGFSLTSADGRLIEFAGDRPIALLAYLLLHRHAPLSRQHMAYTLWPDSTESQARTNLRNLLYTLRQTIPNADSYISADSMTLAWRLDAPYILDVAEYEEALAGAATAQTAQERIACLTTAVAIYRGELFPGNYDDWIVPRREELHESLSDTLRELIIQLEQLGSYREATRYGQRLLLQDPLDESTYVHLMRLYARNGDRAGVQRIYERCQAVLRKELDLEPAEATRAAFKQSIQAEVSAANLVSPRPLSAATRPRPLPLPATPFLGREEELAQTASYLANPACRLITIVGPGGIGKTRLALSTAVANQDRFQDGVVFVSLAPVAGAVETVSAIATALNFTFSGQGAPRSQLISYLDGKKMLLVLDNVEQLLAEIDILTELLQGAANIVILATSRERLSLQEEWLLPLEGLAIPIKAGADSIANPSVQLFLQSAWRLHPGFKPTEQDLAAICRICELVGGMPLGLELAATWLRLLSTTEIAAELEQNMDLLATNARNIPSRHQSMRAVFDYSWVLLSNAEQELFRKLSVFRGGFTREAAQQVAGASLPLLAALVDKSLIRFMSSGRYTVHNLIRQYAAEKLALDPDLLLAVAAKHSSYYLHLAAKLESVLCGPNQKDALARFTADSNNILIAWTWAANHLKLPELRAASWPYWYSFELRGSYREGENALQAAEDPLLLAMTQSGPQSQALRVAYAKILAHRAFFSFRRGSNDQAQAAVSNAVALLREENDADALADALWTYGAICWVGGQFAPGVDALREALQISQDFPRSWPRVVNAIFLGILLHELSEYQEAYELLSGALDAAWELGDPRPITFGISYLSRTAQALGRTEQMMTLLQEGLRQAIEMDDRFAIGLSWEHLGQGMLALGRLDEALRCFSESIGIYRETGDSWSLARAFVFQGEAYAGADALQSEISYRQGLATAVAAETWPIALDALYGLAKLYAYQDQPLLAWLLTMIISRQPAAQAVLSGAGELQRQLEPLLTTADRAAVLASIEERSLADLAADILRDNLLRPAEPILTF